MKKLQLSQMKYKDSRARLMTEILNNMKSIKLYAWGSAFMDKLSHVRNDLELNNLRKIGAAQSFATFTWSSTPFFVSCSTFAVFVLVNKQPLTTDLVFPALTLFNLLTFPLTVLPSECPLTINVTRDDHVLGTRDYVLTSSTVTLACPKISLSASLLVIRSRSPVLTTNSGHHQHC